MRWIAIIAASLIITAMAPFSMTPLQAAEPLTKIKPVMILDGKDSEVSKAAYDRCCTQDSLREVWNKHCGVDTVRDKRTWISVDFDSYMVLAVFDGNDPDNSWLGIFEIVEDKDCIHLRLYSRGKQTGVSGGEESEADKLKNITQSYAFIVLPASKKAVVVEEDTGRSSGVPLGWKELKKFPAIDKKK